MSDAATDHGAVVEGVASDAAIDVEELAHRYGARQALRGLTFSVAYGEILGFLGPNGAGKTTTVKILTGQLRPTEGRARVAGLELPHPHLGRHIGVMFEQQNLYDRLTVQENLDFFARLHGVNDARVREVLGEADLADRARDLVSALSKGLRQRVMLARALLGRPRVLFLDEPTSGLDPHAARSVRAWVRRLAGEGAAILLTTHDMEEAADLCGRVAILNEGALVALESPRALVARISPPRLRVLVRRGPGGEEDVLLPPQADEAARALTALQQEAEVLAIAEEASSLADVFLALTGRTLDL